MASLPANANVVPHASAPPPVDQGLEFDLSGFFRFVQRRWKLIAATVVAAVTLVLIIVLQQTPRYTATSSVAIEYRKTQVVDIQDVVSEMAPDQATMETQVSILQSRTLIGKLVDELQLDRDPEFNTALGANGSGFNLMAPSTWFGGAETETSDELTDEEKLLQRDAVISAVASSLNVKLVPRSYIVTISATSASPEKAARVANAMADVYINDQIEAKYEATRRASWWLEKRVEELRRAVADSEQAVEMYRSMNGLVQGTGGAVDSQQLSEINSQLIIARTERAAKEAQLAQLRQLSAGGGAIDTSSAILSSPIVLSLRQQEGEVNRKLAELRATYGDRHPRIINAEAEARDIRAKIQEEVRKAVATVANEVSVARAREGALSASLGSLRGSVGRNSQAEVRLRALEREAEANRTLFETFLSRYKETREQVGVQTADARIVSTAALPRYPSYPNKTVAVTLAAVISLLGGFAIAFAVEKLDNTIRSAEQIERMGGGTALTFVPRVRAKDGSPEDAIVDRPGSMAAEALRTLRGALTLFNVDNPPQVVMLTSSVPGEGKTFISVGLARTLALSGQRVVIVDADMRHPRAHKVLGLENDRGLVQVLSGQSTLDDALKVDPRTNLIMLTAGMGAPNPGDLLRSVQFSRLIERLRQEFETVIVDTPPFVPLTDSQIVSTVVDAVLLVVRWGSTPVPVVANTIKQLHKLNAKLAGSVISQVDMDVHARYGYGDYGYYYSKYSGYYGSVD